MVVSPKWMIYNGKPYEQMDDLGVPLFLETPTWTFLRYELGLLPSHNAQVLLKGLVVEHIYTCKEPKKRKTSSNCIVKNNVHILSQGLNSIWSCLSCCTCLWWVIAPSTRASTTRAEIHMQQSNVTKFALWKSWACGNWFFRFGEAELHHLNPSKSTVGEGAQWMLGLQGEVWSSRAPP